MTSQVINTNMPSKLFSHSRNWQLSTCHQNQLHACNVLKSSFDYWKLFTDLWQETDKLMDLRHKSLLYSLIMVKVTYQGDHSISPMEWVSSFSSSNFFKFKVDFTYYLINTRHVCTYFNAFFMLIPNIVTPFRNFDIFFNFDLVVCSRGKC